jgi:hypothetical protein
MTRITSRSEEMIRRYYVGQSQKMSAKLSTSLDWYVYILPWFGRNGIWLFEINLSH